MKFFKENYDVNSYLILPSYAPLAILQFIIAYFSALLFRKKDSIIVIQSIYTKSFYATALKLLVKIRKKNTFYDLDDADYLRYPPETIYYFLKNCSTVTLGSSELIKNLSKFNPNSILITCPTQDLNNLPFKVKLILMGVCRKDEYEFLTEYFKSFENFIVEIPQDINWLNEIAIQEKIATFDIGIATLLDDEFSRSKSAFKLKQCFNNGVPVLSSNIPENNLFIDHGKNGYLCESLTDFRQRIIEFNEMENIVYKTFSSNARNSIHRFNLTNFCDNFIIAFEKNARIN